MGTVIPENVAIFDFDRLVACVGGKVVAGDTANVVGVSTDSRRVRPGNAFVALVGETFDGHDHAREASEAGASVLIVSKDVDPAVAAVVIRVDDTLEALGRLGKEHRQQWAASARARGWQGKVVGVTGSAGKTTTCRAITAVLEAIRSGEVHAPVGNLNNAIGVPMVLLGLEPRHGQAVVEIGTSGPGEIAYGAGLTQPDVAVITLVACAHTLGLGSIEAVAQEKGAIYASLPASGVCVANADDPHVMAQAHRSRGARVLTFGRHEEADVRVIESVSRGWQGQDVRMQVRWGSRLHTLVASVPLLGGAGVYASSAALAVALAICGDDRDLESAARGLGNLRAELGRLRPRALARGAVVIDDAYNANPASMRDSIEVAAELAAQQGRSLTLVLGEMRELGAQSEREHRRVGEQVARVRAGLLVAVCGDAKHYAQAASSAGVSSVFVPDASRAVGPLLEGVGDRDVILVKGSRGVALEGVVRSLNAWGEEPGS